MMRRVSTVRKEDRLRVRDQMTAEVAAVPEVVFAYLYGSFVDSEVFRDVDIGVYLRRPEPGQMTPRALALAQRLSTRVGLPVDVRILNGAPLSFLYHVLRGQLLVNRDEDLLSEVIERTVYRYLDIEPLLRSATKDAFAA